jgi:hypothetical protein
MFPNSVKVQYNKEQYMYKWYVYWENGKHYFIRLKEDEKADFYKEHPNASYLYIAETYCKSAKE